VNAVMNFRIPQNADLLTAEEILASEEELSFM
jgi:hypothetical protein